METKKIYLKDDLSINDKAFNLLEETQLNWGVTKESLVSTNGKTTESHGIFRNDSNQWLGTVGNDYVPLQNSELALILLNAIEGFNIELTRGGQLKEGKKVYLQAELPEEYIGKSKLKRWVTSLNSHDGSTSVGFGSSNTVIVCQNTFFRSYGEIQKFRHTTTMKAKIELAQMELRKTIEMDTQLMESFKRMADLPLRDEVIEKVIKKLFRVEQDTPQSEISVQKKNKIVDFANSLQTSIGEQGSTVWALFNGITRFSNHIAAPSEITKKMDYIMLTGGLSFMNNGYEVLNNYTIDNTPKQHFLEKSN